MCSSYRDEGLKRGLLNSHGRRKEVDVYGGEMWGSPANGRGGNLPMKKGQDITLLGEFLKVAPLNFVGKFHGK